MDAFEFQKNSLVRFDERIGLWMPDKARYRVEDAEEIKRKLSDLVDIGKYLNIEIGAGFFDRMEKIESLDGKLRIYPNKNERHYAESTPAYMLVSYSGLDPRDSYIALKGLGIIVVEEEHRYSEIIGDAFMLIHPKGSKYNNSHQHRDALMEELFIKENDSERIS